jgi:leucyl aminopeptidase
MIATYQKTNRNSKDFFMTSRLTLQFVSQDDASSYPVMVLVSAKDGKAELDAAGKALDHTFNGALSRAMTEASFKAEPGEDVVVRAAEGSVILLGAGGNKAIGVDSENLGGHVMAAMARSKLKDITLLANGRSAEWVASLAYGAYLAGYHFSRYFTKGKNANPAQASISIVADDPQATTAAYHRFEGIASGVFMARDLVSEPSNILYPAEYANRCLELSQLGVEVQVLNDDDMSKEGMNLLLAVGQGSERESRMVVMRWNGGGDEDPIVLIGKGVCFDTGGISIKPAGGMEDMKWDMGGSAAVVGAMKAIAAAGIKRNVIGLVGLVENMPDGKAIKPGDVVTSMSGQTVEIINTDAEGRLVLADVMTYAQRYFKPAVMIDLATLTGAILVSLGMVQSGLFANDDHLASAISDAAAATGEGTWRMPLGKDYDKLINSKIADMKNIGGRYGGSVTAACFLQRFVENGTPWAHLDIAGMAWSDKDKPTTPAGGTGYGVRLLTHLVEHFEASSKSGA